MPGVDCLLSNYKAGPGIYRYLHVYLSMYVFNHFIPDYLLHELAFFNTFEELHLPIQGPMEDSGVVKLYEPSPTPCLYVAPALLQRTWWAEPPLCRYFWLEPQL